MRSSVLAGKRNDVAAEPDLTRISGSGWMGSFLLVCVFTVVANCVTAAQDEEEEVFSVGVWVGLFLC